MTITRCAPRPPIAAVSTVCLSLILAISSMAARAEPLETPITLAAVLRVTDAEGPSADRARASKPLAIGTAWETTLAAGLFDGRRGLACGARTARSLADLEPRMGRATEQGHAWQLTATVLDRDLDAFRIALGWQRASGGPDGALTVAERGAATITLRAGERRTLDFVRIVPPAGVDCAMRHAMLELEATFMVNPLAERTIDYRLWLLHRTPDGGETVRQVALPRRRHGESVEFDFDGEALPIAGLRYDHQPFEIVDRYGGRVRGWITGDDQLLLVLDARVGARHGEPAHGGMVASGAGTKRFTVASGEAVEVVLPNSRATIGFGIGPYRLVGPVPPGITVDDRKIEIQLGTLMAGHRYALRLTATLDGP